MQVETAQQPPLPASGCPGHTSIVDSKPSLWQSDLAQLPVARYRFEFRLTDPLRLPDYAGSLLRGHFGAGLRQAACVTRQPTCVGCPLLQSCPYPAIFEAPAPAAHALQRFSQVPNPYVIEPPPIGSRMIEAGGRLSFGLVLVGRALQQLPLISYAFQRAFSGGVGPQRARAVLEDILLEAVDQPGLSIWDTSSAQVMPHDPQLQLPAFGKISALTLRFATPLRLQHQGKPLAAADLAPRTLITALMRRASLLFELQADIPVLIEAPAMFAREAASLTDTRDLRWRDWTRYSSRQRAEMKLGGVLGSWRIMGDLTPFHPLLWLGQWLHVGKNATMGLGRYTIEYPERPALSQGGQDLSTEAVTA